MSSNDISIKLHACGISPFSTKWYMVHFIVGCVAETFSSALEKVTCNELYKLWTFEALIVE